jgi:hypothetical protein
MLPEKPTEPSRNGRFRKVAMAGLASKEWSGS